MVTDVEGRITQNVAYIPFGEVFVEERDGNWSTPYLFNAKEMDSETGLYYYGARYLDPTAAMWMTVDPLFEKYPGMSPYNYCAGNPVKYVDPDGRKIVFSDARTQSLFYQEMKKIEGNEKLNRYYKSLVSSDLTYTIKGTPRQSQFVQKTTKDNSLDYHSEGRTYNDENHFLGIEFDFSVTMRNKNNNEITWPTVAVLNHELTHAAQFDACIRIIEFGENPNDFADIVPELLSDESFIKGEYSDLTGSEVFYLFYSGAGTGNWHADVPTEIAAIRQETEVTKYVNPQFKYENTREHYQEGETLYGE